MRENFPFSCCAIDIGSPKLDNIGWAINSVYNQDIVTGNCIDTFAIEVNKCMKLGPLLMTIDAPLFVPLRSDIKLATKGRSGEGRSPWSAGAGAQVLAMNIPIMTYLFRKMLSLNSEIKFTWSEYKFSNTANLVFISEALIAGKVKGSSHIEDAKIMSNYCYKSTSNGFFPKNILLAEENVEYINLVAMSLLALGAIQDIRSLNSELSIYRPEIDNEKV